MTCTHEYVNAVCPDRIVAYTNFKANCGSALKATGHYKACDGDLDDMMSYMLQNAVHS